MTAVPDMLSICCRGLVPSQHTAGASFKKSSMKVGQKVTVRVLDCDAPNRRLTLTMKKLLLEEKLAPFTSWEVCFHQFGQTSAFHSAQEQEMCTSTCLGE